jgi:coatomer subunit beta
LRDQDQNIGDFTLKQFLTVADFLGDFNTASALDVVFFVREIMETNAQLRDIILLRLLESFKEIRSSRVCSSALWIIGEYCNSKPDIRAAMEVSPPPSSITAKK